MKKNFTLIELLCCLAVSALLITFALAAVDEAAPISKSALCANNQKELFKVMSDYCAANTDHYPAAYETNTGLYWFDKLSRQAKLPSLHGRRPGGKPSVFLCPEVRACYGTDFNAPDGGTRYGTNYAYNAFLPESDSSVGLSKAVLNPEKTVLFCDAHVFTDAPSKPKVSFYVVSDPEISNVNIGKAAPNYKAHTDKAVVCFADGSTKEIAAGELTAENINPEWE